SPVDVPSSPDAPIVGATWADAAAYCAFVDKRLPTEAEWEKAARGPEGRRYPWGEAAPDCEKAVFQGCGPLAAVDSHPAGASVYAGLNRAGNAAEWGSDWSDPAAYGTAVDRDPTGPVDGTLRITRGGSFDSPPADLSSSRRTPRSPGDVQP